MAVRLSEVLHVLAHELRTPVGIAYGYVRLLLEDRLPQEGDRRRALEQTQKALARLTDLSHESSALAAWDERETHGGSIVSARAVLERVRDGSYERPIQVDLPGISDEQVLRVLDVTELSHALVTIVRATARELGAEPCSVVARTQGHWLEVLAGSAELLGELGDGPDAPRASAVAFERGGMGLALIYAAAVLESHDAQHWTIDGSRQSVGIRLPLEETP